MRKNKQPAALPSRKAIAQQHINFICHKMGGGTAYLLRFMETAKARNRYGYAADIW